MTTETALERILDALQGQGLRYRASGGGYSAQCPAHQDRNPSLSLRQIEGQALVKCFGGCATEDVIAALNLSMRDLFDEPRGAQYVYTDAAGQPTRTVHRTPDKQFRQSGETKLKQLYRLPKVLEAVAAGQTVYLVEGEKDVHALESLGAVATTAPEGADRIDRVDVSPLKGAQVVAVADRDAAGEKWAAAVRARLTGYAAKLQLVQAKIGKDAADHILAGHGLADFEPVAVGDSWEEPLPLGWQVEARQFPAGVFPPVVERYVRALAEATQTPADMAGTVTLGMLAACIGGRVEVQCPTWVEPTNLFTVPVMPPASRKSAVVAACRTPLTDAERQLRDDMGSRVYDTQTRWEILYKRAEAAKNAAAKDGDPILIDEAQEAVRAAEEAKAEIVVWPRLTTSDATPEALVTLLAEQGGRIAAVSAEAGIFASLTGRYSKSPNLDPVLQAHAGDTLTVDRRSRAPEHIERPALTLVASIQPFALRELVERDDFAGRGLLARVLWSVPCDNAGYRRVRDVPAVPEDVAEAYRALLVDLAVRMAEAKQAMVLKLDATATEVLYDYADQVERSLRPTGDLGQNRLTREWGGKLVGATARIAGCLHAAGGNLDESISAHTMRAAVEMGEYFRAHAIAALGTTEDKRAGAGRTVLEVAIRREMATFSMRELMRRVPRALQNADQLLKVLDYLAQLGWVRSAGKGWELHPRTAQLLEGADSADSADSSAVSAGHGSQRVARESVSSSADTADSSGHRGESVSTVSTTADTPTRSTETAVSSGNADGVSTVSTVSTQHSWWVGSDRPEHPNCLACRAMRPARPA